LLEENSNSQISNNNENDDVDNDAEEDEEEDSDILTSKDKDVSDIETMLDTTDKTQYNKYDVDSDESDYDNKKKTHKYNNDYEGYKYNKGRYGRRSRPVYAPEPRDPRKVLPCDPFAVPNVSESELNRRRILKHKNKSILLFDSTSDPLPYADHFTRFRKVADSSDFLPYRNPKDFKRHPSYDPVPDPLVREENPQPTQLSNPWASSSFDNPSSPNSSPVSNTDNPPASYRHFKRYENPATSSSTDLFHHVIRDQDVKQFKDAERNTAAMHDKTWQSGEFKGVGGQFR